VLVDFLGFRGQLDVDSALLAYAQPLLAGA
jgi:hypothetical protein